MQTQSVQVISIHDKQDGFLTFDLPDILEALGLETDDYVWTVNIWDWEGQAGALPDEGLLGAVMTTAQLRSLYQFVTQTVAGEFAGGPRGHVATLTSGSRPDLRRFRELPLLIGILALDCNFFVVWAKEERHVRALKERFRDVRTESVADWCDA